MDEVGDDLFARAAFAGNQNRHVTWSDAFDGPDDRFHGGALKNRSRSTAHRNQGFAQRTGLFIEALVFDGPFDRKQQCLGVEGFVLKVVSAAFGGFDGSVECGESGQDNDFSLGPLVF